MKSPYPNSAYVARYSRVREDWIPIPESAGSRAYAQGYLNALDSMYPHDGYRLYDRDGGLYEERPGRAAPTPGGR